MKKTKKVLGLFLCLAVICSAVNITAFAAKRTSKSTTLTLFDAEDTNTYVNGLVSTSDIKADGRKSSGCWTFGVRNQLNFSTPEGIGDYVCMSFNIYGGDIPGIFFIRLLGGDNPKAYYMLRNVSAQPGWNKVVVPLEAFSAAGGAEFSMSEVSVIQFLCEGWGMENLYGQPYEDIKNDIKVYFDDITLHTEDVSATAVVSTDFEYDREPLKDFDGIALAINESNAYAGGGLTKVDSANEQVSPVISDSRTLVPVRFISESFGAEVGWDNDTREVSVKLDGKSVSLAIDSDKMLVDGEEKILDVPAQIINERTMIPLRAMAEAVDKNVFWDPRGLIIITPKEKTIDETADFKVIDSLLGCIKNGKVTYYNQSPELTQSIIDEAVKTRLMYFTKGLDTSNFGCGGLECKGAKALYYLTMAAGIDENAVSSGGVYAKDRAIEQLTGILYDGREPFCSSGPYWGHSVLSSALLLVKNTPAVYDELTDSDKERMDWLMKALAITGNWGFNDCNNYSTGFDMRGNFGKGWNPNYRAAGLIPVLNASMYFGAENLDKIFTSFSYDEYMAKFKEFGFENIIYSWEIAGKNAMENGGSVTMIDGTSGGDGAGVRQAFVYNGNSIKNITAISCDLMNYIYGAQVKNYAGIIGTSSYAYIVSGKTSPYEGQMGMMREFDATDGNGLRSSAGYCYDSMMCVIPFYTNLKMFGGWDSSTEEMRAVDKKIYVGTQDLIFKLTEGYKGYQKGKAETDAKYEYSEASLGYAMDKDIWQKVHLFSGEDTAYVKDPNAVAYEEVEAKDGEKEAPEGSLESISNPGLFTADIFYKLDESYSGKFEINFDLTYSANVNDEFDGVITFHDKAQEGLTYKDLNILIQSLKSSINIMNGSEGYLKTGLAAAANYKYHFRIAVDTDSETYSVWVTPTYPNEEAEKLVADNYGFRSSGKDIESIGVIGLVTQGADASMWVENLTVTQ